ncbi:hypothetical protein ACRE_025750 [Hapsidospora chrysogenum ATCC 11550]|uniref:GDP/GTP exchange factor Sec2 N-terminal domain-containing protein n=1 Tax=Hapsidospora chrysogenum (strain ATCC 11550 / CBS 779.69 / DSM 880 / IAM 14645 / JCM 23072 / IMI 49137) TaxID=857340 RepID=A0A086TB73_HAPC1|nr:hypothetical protein ACRE_025750 [Hapsidospora chrysogenum ATCC 11550]
MSSTMVLTMADTAPPPPTTLTTLGTSCPSCGSNDTLEQTQSQLLHAHARIAELESQVRLLNQKATAAVDRWADYEDELTRLRAQHGGGQPAPPPPPPKNDPSSTSSPTQNSEGGLSSGGMLQTGTNRLSSLLSRKSTPNLAQQQQQQQQQRTQPDTEDLIKALTREKSLRKEAEGRIAATSREVEELSASLFEQANEMVADERRARAKLEERVGELERRDREKRRRLERLESAMTRIEKVRNLLNES